MTDRARALIALRMAAEAMPGLRITQIIANAVDMSDPYYLTDNALAILLERYIKENTHS
jgi:hypothetical protein